jgi:uncharacterized protein
MSTIVSFQEPYDQPDSYHPDAARIEAGDPIQTAANLFSSADTRFNCGIWTGGVGRWQVNFTENEFCHLLEGLVVLTSSEGQVRTFRAGDTFVIPAGFVGTWEVLQPARKLYAVYE